MTGNESGRPDAVPGVTTTENPVLCERHQGQHPLASDCQWPHLVSPPGRQPRVGHPLTTRD